MRWFDRARNQASAFDELPAGAPARTAPFGGVPFLVKDLHMHLAGLPLTSGNRAAKQVQPLSKHDSNLFTRFREAGQLEELVEPQGGRFGFRFRLCL